MTVHVIPDSNVNSVSKSMISCLNLFSSWFICLLLISKYCMDPHVLDRIVWMYRRNHWVPFLERQEKKTAIADNHNI